MQTVGAKLISFPVAFPRKLREPELTAKIACAALAAFRTVLLIRNRRYQRNESKVEADATRSNWIRDFDQFPRQRDLPVPVANPEFTVRITTRIAADSAESPRRNSRIRARSAIVLLSFLIALISVLTICTLFS